MDHTVMVPIMKKRIENLQDIIQEKKPSLLQNEEDEDETLDVMVVKIAGTTYLKAADNTLYDFNSHEEIGIWNPKAKKYILLNGNNLQNLQAINELLNQIEEIHVECEYCEKKATFLLCDAEGGKINGFDEYGVWWCEKCEKCR